MDPQLGTASCRGLHKSRVHFIISTTSGRSFTIICLKYGIPCQGTTNHVDGWSSTARTKYSFLSDPDNVDRVGRGEIVLQSDWLLAYGAKRRTSREGQNRREQFHWNSQHPPSLRSGCLLTAELTHCLESWTQPGNGYPRPVRTMKTLLFCTTIELPETEGRKVWRRKPECEKSEICGREASGPHFGPIRTETPPAFYSPQCR
ncbi:hypothetical protein CABS01_03377 [Colletotrichum abscissum]|uniref:Uncharacterized protein n=1 Tax=Colletotrichum abscissum TaxID=1671311 RepID=A0A9Q0B126_9PEZI|nr:uncharacterized protein CABS01_03377 [Colletotrichum abscissum]KAI3538973.1 hypothetical protein CABS02_11564 [Colletotrichum abscissum]KAK1478075.1 hypothetical protein CABS01_03377 [Colletotrichum abscissum]